MGFHRLVTLLVCGMLLLLSSNAQTSADTSQVLDLTFEGALAFTRGNNHTLKQAAAEIEEKERERRAVKGLYLPSISLNATYTYMSDDIHLDMTSVQDAITPLYEALGNYGVFSGVPNPDPATSPVMPILPDEYSTQAVRGQLMEGLDAVNAAEWNVLVQKNQFALLNAGFMQPIYTGGKIRLANQVAEIELEEAGIQSREKDAKLYTQLIERYYGLVLSQHVVKVREAVNSTMQRHLFDAERMMQEGVISNAEYLHARVYSSEAERELKKAQRQYDIVSDALNNTLTFGDTIRVNPITSLFYVEEIESLSYFQELALINSPLLQQIESKQELAHKGYKAEVSEYLPTMAAMGTYNMANKDLSHLVPDYFVGVGMKWDLFKGNARNNKIQAAKHVEAQAEHFYLQSEADILTAVNKYYQELNMYLEQLDELTASMEFANEYHTVREKAFKEGMATTSEVSDAELLVAKVRIERLQAIYYSNISLANLLYYTGTPDKYLEYQLSNKAIFEN